MRYPLLWERTAPDGEPSWDWPDSRLAHLRRLGVQPVVGLIHHGSGPRCTDLLDPQFPEKFSSYARGCAERYPWIEDYIPVNEPLTTARFSGLYGHWYPHHTDDFSFAYALLNQCRAAVMAMHEIRGVNPAARFVQTEDLGKIFSSRKLRYQADFENERRWLTFDLLCGRVDRFHPLWPYFAWAGIEERQLQWFTENPCIPDVLGINHYLTSDRYLDENLDKFPATTHGGNGRHRYADVEAVRVCEREILGPGARIREAWERYQLPIAVTEAHLGCAEIQEQLRWLWDVWKEALAQESRGVEVRAVTAWSALGAYDWDSLVVRAAGSYEVGLFDSRHTPPRATLLAEMVKDIATRRHPSHPAADQPGWWKRPERISYLRDAVPETAHVAAPWPTHGAENPGTLWI
jgi:dTDP-4-dehydrorhamnose reductase